MKNRGWANIIFYGMAVIVDYLLMNCFVSSKGDEYLWLAQPISVLVGVGLGKAFAFQPGVGLCEPGGIVISKACSGMGFFLIFFSMLIFGVIGKFQKTWEKAAAFASSLIVSYVVTVVVNAFRIMGVSFLLRVQAFDGFLSRASIHRIFGMLIYLFFLSLGYGAARRLIKKEGDAREKTAQP